MEENFSFSKLVFYEKIFHKNAKALTLPELVIKLIFEKDKKFSRVFFKTYHSIKNWSCQRFLELLLELFEKPIIQFEIDPNSHILQFLIVSTLSDLPAEVTTIRVAVVNLIKDCMSSFYDFYEDPTLIETLDVFVDHQLEINAENVINVKICRVLKDKIISFRKVIDEFTIPAVPCVNPNPPSIITPLFLTTKLSVDLIALHLTYYDFEMMKLIHFREFFDPSNSKNIQISKYFSHFNRMKNMIISEISTRHQESIQFIQKMIRIAERCLDYSNFNTPMLILSALFSSNMMDYEKAKIWEALPAKSIETLEKLTYYISPEENYVKYRTQISNKTFFIPFLGAHIENIRYIHEFSSPQSSEFINLEKLHDIYEEYSTFSGYWGSDFPFKFQIDEDFLAKFTSYISQFPEYIDNTKQNIMFLDKQDDPRFNYLREQFETFYFDSLSGFTDDAQFNCIDNQMRARDWLILATNSVPLHFTKNQTIFKEDVLLDTSKVYILTEGKVKICFNGTKLVSILGPAVLAASTLVDSPHSFEVVTEGNSTVCVVEKDFIFSLLDSDPYLSLRFFSSLNIQAINLLRNSNFRNCIVEQANVGSIRDGNYRVISTRLANVKLFDPNLERDREVREIFSWRNDEALIKKYDATLIGKINIQGSLFITQNHVCFYSKILLNKSKTAVELCDISDIKKDINQRLIVKVNARKKEFVFRLKDNLEDEAFNIINGLVKSIEFSREPSSPEIREVEWQTSSLEAWQKETVNIKQNNIQLTEVDWSLIMKSSKLMTFQRNDVIINESEFYSKLFRIVSGSCRIETIYSGQKFIISAIGNSELFGEIGFIQNKGATASVIVDSEESQIAVTESNYIRRLFTSRPEIAVKFLYYLFCVILRRLGNRYWYETQDERKVVDIVVEPLYNTFARFAVVPEVSNKIVYSISGPLTNEIEELENFKSNSKPFISAISVSTYPVRNLRKSDDDNNDNDSKGQLRDGHPICDQYKAIILNNRCIVAVADGCNWGEAPRNAAIAAINAFCSYLYDHHNEGNNLQFIASLVQRAFSMANAAIVNDKENTINVGTTTLLGGIILQLETQVTNPYWGFVYGSVGDCKIFHWSVETGKFSDITQFNRNQSQSATDPGGRLGPHINGLEPDLRNFELGFFPCVEGDHFFLVSDGVHDNLDPALLGFEPSDFELESSTWESITNYQLLEEIKTKFRLLILETIIFNELDQSNIRSILEKKESQYRKLPPPEVIVENLIEHCRYFCQAAVDWMQENPFKRLPKDYKLYPGKMDHTTIMCYCVGPVSQHNGNNNNHNNNHNNNNNINNNNQIKKDRRKSKKRKVSTP